MTVREELSRMTSEELMISDPVTFLSSVTFRELIESPVSTVQPTSTTPDVLNRTRLIFGNVGAVSVTNFLYGQEGQEIKILGDGQTTLVHGALIKTNTGANKLLLTNKVYTFTHFNNVWIENA